jgi:peptidyl-tRNA hydrolase, PTH2 family
MSEMKQVIVLRQDLDMGGGKAVAQGCHAARGAQADSKDRWGPIGPDMIEGWIDSRWKTVTLCAYSEEELLALAKKCEEKNMGYYLVRDAGRTEVEPGTITALGIGPDFARHIDGITGHLGLF